MLNLGELAADDSLGVAGFHLFTYNQVRAAERWRSRLMTQLGQVTTDCRCRVAVRRASTVGSVDKTNFAWRGPFDSAELEALHGAAFGHSPVDHDWWGLVDAHSLGWVTAHDDGRLVGFVNVAWDGAGHAFILDTIVAADVERLGIGTRLVLIATESARAAGCEWLHVDFDDHLRDFYFTACGFEPTNAGLIEL